MPNPEDRLHQPYNVAAPPVQYVKVVNVDIKFWTMVWLMVKYSIAAIPAAIILGLIVAALFIGLTALVSI